MLCFPLHPLRLWVFWFFLPLLVAQCSAGEEAGTAKPAQPVELRWVTFDMNSQVEEALIEKFQVQNPAIIIKREASQPGRTDFAAMPAPDLIMHPINYYYHKAIQQQQLTDLSPLWAEADFKQKLLANIQQLGAAHGKQFIVPAGLDTAAIYYNKAIFAQYQLQPPQTWEQFLQTCATLQAHGETPLAMTGADSASFMLWFDYLNLRLNGADYHRNLISGKESYDDPRVQQVLQLWGDLFRQGYVIQTPDQLNDFTATITLIHSDKNTLSRAKAVMMLMSSYTSSQMPPKFRAELDVFRFPIIDPSIPPAEAVGAIGYVVPIQAEHKAAAQLFLAYLSTPEAQLLLGQQTLLDDVTFTPVGASLKMEALPNAVRQALALIQHAESLVPFTSVWAPSEMQSAFRTGYQRFLRSEYDAQAFVNTIEAGRQDAVKKGVFTP